MKPAKDSRTIVFSHANGFPSGTYRILFEAWRQAGFTVHAIEKFGHDPRYPVTSNWPHLRDQLVDFIQHEAGAAVYLVGHSLGGYLSLMAASRRPDLALGVVLLDSPILSGWKARTVQFAKFTGVSDRFPPAQVSKRRREHWPSSDQAFEHFASKPAFARWAPGVLRDYINAGTEPQGKGRGLAFDRAIESEIYTSLPHHLARLLRTHPLQCQLAFVGGTESEELKRVGLSATARLAHGRVSHLEGSHLFPLERPVDTAAEVLRWIGALQTPRL